MYHEHVIHGKQYNFEKPYSKHSGSSSLSTTHWKIIIQDWWLIENKDNNSRSIVKKNNNNCGTIIMISKAYKREIA